MKKIYFLLFAMTVLSINCYPQIKIHDNGRVAIDATSPDSKFQVGTEGTESSKVSFYNTASGVIPRTLQITQEPGTSWTYGAISNVDWGSTGVLVGLKANSYRGSTQTTGQTYGLYGLAGNGIAPYNAGVYARLAGTRNGAGLFACIQGKESMYPVNGIYAGYFRGNVKVENTIYYGSLQQISDLALKKEVRNLEPGNLNKIKQLQAIKYKVKHPTELESFEFDSDTASIEDFQKDIDDPLYTEDQFGVSAQELQVVYPDLVKEGPGGYLTVNYIGLIPVLLEAIKEQQIEIEALKEDLIEIRGLEPRN